MGGPVAKPLAAELMTLAGIAYGKPSAIPGYLANDPFTKGTWGIVWIAQDVVVPVTFAFIARNQNTGAYAVVIRGTYPDPFSQAYWSDASLDYPLGPLQPWPPSASSGAKVSNGSWNAFTDLIALSDGTSTFAAALNGLPSDATVYVTGHSLGGTLAPVIALWLDEQSKRLPATVFAFAGMTPGNQAFADLFGSGSALADRVWRFNNSLDTVPYGWDKVLATVDFYQPAPQGGLAVSVVIASLAAQLIGYGYAPIGSEVVLPGKLKAEPLACQLVAYVLENLYQHMPDTYLELLGAPPLPFTLTVGSIVIEKARVEASQVDGGALPVFYID